MTANFRRFTISVSKDLELDLNKVKKDSYCDNSQIEMIRDLILRGLNSLSAEEVKDEKHERSA